MLVVSEMQVSIPTRTIDAFGGYGRDMAIGFTEMTLTVSGDNDSILKLYELLAEDREALSRLLPVKEAPEPEIKVGVHTDTNEVGSW